WIYDLTGTDSPRRLTFSGNSLYPIWTPDGEKIVFFLDRDGDSGLFWQRADGNGPAERLLKNETGRQMQPESWSRNGKVLTYGVDPGSRTATIWAVSLGSAQPPKLLIQTPRGSATNSIVSPDGKWVAYASTEIDNRLQVYVQPFPPDGTKHQVSHAGTNHH